YEDQGDSYAYQQGAHAIVPIHWDDARRVLTLGAREGSYPGMAPGHTFEVVLVAPGHGIGGGATANPDKTITYSGTRIEAKF
ncbi:MAG: DUF5110 domain-containing protein, partial [Acidobacteriota bacterium]